MKILALDLGTTTGWACFDGDRIVAGSRRLMSPREVSAQAKLRMDRRLDGRIPALWELLEDLDESCGPFDWLVFEDVQFGSTTMQAHLWASFRTTVWLYAFQHDRKTECLATGRLKVFAANHGAATKDMMAAWAVQKYPNDIRFFDGKVRLVQNDVVLDDNAVDAVHLLNWARQTIKT